MAHRAYRLAVLCVASAAAACASSPRAGQSAQVQFGVVRDAAPVTLDSNATSGALIGGTIGLSVSRGRTTPRRAQNAVLGMGVGGALAADTNRRGMSYTVDMMDGSALRIVSDQREIRPGDCVAIERVRSTANIRRAAEQFCDAQNAEAVGAVQASVRDMATQCAAAKDELVRASDTDEADLAERKIELLCNA